MMKIIYKPTRMCISCRGKSSQDELLRFQYFNGSLERFLGQGRSFYLCRDCISQEKKVSRSLMRQCRSGEKDKLMNRLKEIIADDRKS